MPTKTAPQAHEDQRCKYCNHSRVDYERSAFGTMWLFNSNRVWVCPWCRDLCLDVKEAENEFDKKFITCDKCSGKGYVER